MEGIFIMRLTDAVALLMLAMALMMLVSRKMLDNIKLLTFQAMLIAFLALSIGVQKGEKELLIAAIFTLVVKAFLIPRYLKTTVSNTENLRETSYFLSLRLTLLIAFALVVVAYHFAGPLAMTAKVTSRNVIPVALGVTMLGMLMIVARKKVISHIIGLIEMENGIYLLAVSVVGGMPLVVEFGVFFDILVLVVIMVTFSKKIGDSFTSLNTDNLRNLKG